MRQRLVFSLVVMASLVLGAGIHGAAAPGDPLVLVIHGIGGGNREPGWSKGVADRWMIPVTEITFRQEGRENTSFTDFAHNAGDWALDVQRQIKQAVDANPGRRVIIVSHSWGTVATKLALSGGVTTNGEMPGIDLGGVQIEEWVTLGSPLGRAEDPDVAVNLRQLNVVLSDGKPPVVKDWTNIYDVSDPVSMQSHNLAGAENFATSGSGHWYDVTGLSAHSGIWTNTKVARFIQQKFDAVSDLGPRPTNRTTTRPGPPGGIGSIPPSAPRTPPASTGAGASEQRFQRLAAALMEVRRRDCADRIRKYGGDYKIEYVVSPAPRQKDGKWFVVAAWRLLEKAPGRTSFFPVFEAGDAANPQWMDEAAVVALARQWGVVVQ